MAEYIIDRGQKERIEGIKEYCIPAQKIPFQYFQGEFLEVTGIGGQEIEERGSPDLKKKDQPQDQRQNHYRR